jgi:hypothetical protein
MLLNKNNKTIHINKEENNNNNKEEKVKETKKQIEETKEKVIEDKKPIIDKEYLNYWEEILNKLKSKGKVMICTNLIGTKAKKISDNEVAIEFKCKINSFAKTVLEQADNKEEIEKILSEKEKQKIKVKYIEDIQDSNYKNDEKNDIEILAKQADIPINIIEE